MKKKFSERKKIIIMIVLLIMIVVDLVWIVIEQVAGRINEKEIIFMSIMMIIMIYSEVLIKGIDTE